MDKSKNKPGRRPRLDRAAAARITAAVRGAVTGSATGPVTAAPLPASDDPAVPPQVPVATVTVPVAGAPVVTANGPVANSVAKTVLDPVANTAPGAGAATTPVSARNSDPSARTLDPSRHVAKPAVMSQALVTQSLRRGRALPYAPASAAAQRQNWDGLRPVAVDSAALERNLIITAARAEPAHAAFDVLRTKMMQAITDKGWRRVAITSPTKGCGKSFTALNLAVAFSRYQSQRTVLLDLDLRQPALARRLGINAPGSIGDMLRGQVSPQAHLARFGDNPYHIGPHVALGLNDRPEDYASELFLDTRTSEVIARIEADFVPDVMLFDMPPALAYDDAIALKAQFDCVLMVVGGGVTTPKDLRESVQRLGEDMPILGMVLNKADGVDLTAYTY